MMVLGIFGDRRVRHSLSPRMHNRVLRRLGMEGWYVPFEVEPRSLGEAVRALVPLGIRGVNVTVPHKENTAPFLDELVDDAGALGAVNTVVNRGGRLIGHNTDVEGFRRALLQEKVEVGGRRVLVVGCGGAAKAVLWALRSLKAGAVCVTGRDPQRCEAAASLTGAVPVAWNSWTREAEEADLLVNATSVSNAEDSPEMAPQIGGLNLSAGAWVVDVNYNRSPNMWREAALRAGCRFMDGLSMLAHQAAESFLLWTHREVEAELFREALGS